MINSWKEHHWYTVPCARARIEEIVRRAKGAYTVLEVGCNEGFLSKALMEAGFHVKAVDIDPFMVKRAQELFGVEAIEANVNDLPFMDGQFDLAIAGELLEHISNPGKGLSELFRVSNSRVILSLPIGEYWLGCEEHLWEINNTIIEHDAGNKEILVKKISVLEFIKRRKLHEAPEA